MVAVLFVSTTVTYLPTLTDKNCDGQRGREGFLRYDKIRLAAVNIENKKVGFLRSLFSERNYQLVFGLTSLQFRVCRLDFNPPLNSVRNSKEVITLPAEVFHHSPFTLH